MSRTQISFSNTRRDVPPTWETHCGMWIPCAHPSVNQHYVSFPNPPVNVEWPTAVRSPWFDESAMYRYGVPASYGWASEIVTTAEEIRRTINDLESNQMTNFRAAAVRAVRANSESNKYKPLSQIISATKQPVTAVPKVNDNGYVFNDWLEPDMWWTINEDRELQEFMIATMQDFHLWHTINWAVENAQAICNIHKPKIENDNTDVTDHLYWLVTRPKFLTFITQAISRNMTFPTQTYNTLLVYRKDLKISRESLQVDAPWRRPFSGTDHRINDIADGVEAVRGRVTQATTAKRSRQINLLEPSE